MCKAKEYSEKFLELYKQVEKDFKELSEEQKKYDLMEEDVLHMIENSNFNVVNGYYYAKRLQEIRRARREIKNEVEAMCMLKDNLRKVNFYQVNNKIINKEKQLQYVTDNKVYNSRIFANNNIKEITITQERVCDNVKS